MIGAVVGATLPFLISVDVRRNHSACRSCRRCIPAELVLAIVYGVLTALAFALWPLGRAHDVPVGALFRDMVAPQPRWPRKRYVALTTARGRRSRGARCAAGL